MSGADAAGDRGALAGATVNGVAVKSPIPHPERTQAVRRAWSTQNKPNT
jgi:hypothetical protein